MEGLASLVAESMVRHGFETTFDHRRLQWSKWFRCQDGFSLVLAPFKAGIFALAEEVVPASETESCNRETGKRMLALFHIAEADDLGMALGRILLTSNPLREHLANGRCFARYVVVEDSGQRHAAYAALQHWLATSADAISKTSFVPQPVPQSSELGPKSSNNKAQIGPPTPIPSGF